MLTIILQLDLLFLLEKKHVILENNHSREKKRKLRSFTLDRWNWSERAKQWVYVTLDTDGKRKYIYQIEPPKQFIELTMQIKKVNDKLMKTKDQKENIRLFKQLMEISQKMQNMRLEED